MKKIIFMVIFLVLLAGGYFFFCNNFPRICLLKDCITQPPKEVAASGAVGSDAVGSDAVGSNVVSKEAKRYSATYSEFELESPSSEEHRQYLGLPEEAGKFPLSDIQAEVIILEVFTIYCPYCQEAAPKVNQVHTMIKEAKQENKIKFIGIGMANSEFETEIFREKYSIVYPLFSDPKNLLYKVVGRVQTPFFAILKKKADGTLHKVNEFEHELPSAEEFYRQIVGAL